MPIPVTVITPPAAEPLTLATAKAHLRVDFDDDDATIGTLITAARLYCERWCRRTFPLATLRYTADRFPGNCGAIRLPYPPLVSVSSIAYVDTGGVTQTLAASEYTVDAASQPGRIVPAYSKVWPTTRGHIADVQVTYVAGYASVPATVQQAILLLVGHWYANREGVVTGTISTTVDLAVESLLWSERSEV